MQPLDQAVVEGATSVLISGGCDPQGRVPVLDALEQVAALRADPGLLQSRHSERSAAESKNLLAAPEDPSTLLHSAQGDRYRQSKDSATTVRSDRTTGTHRSAGPRRLNWHVGLIDEPTAAAIAPYVDTISFDLVGDRQTIQECYGLDAAPALYEATYRMLRRHARVVPHITIGLRGGLLGHERPAMDLLARVGLDALVLIVLIPTPGTRYADCDPPAVEQVAGLLAEARLRFPGVPLHLGCMRPRRAYRARLDPLAVRAGVNVLVSPSREGRAAAEALGLEVINTRECCVFV
jgi:uncharacterized radical SAM superfamily protein